MGFMIFLHSNQIQNEVLMLCEICGREAEESTPCIRTEEIVDDMAKRLNIQLRFTITLL